MTKKDTRPGAGKPPEDPWERLARANRAESRGEDVLDHIVGDTARHLRRERTEALEIEGHGPAAEILQLVTQSLAAEPERADLWMMRFEVQRTLGLKAAFAEALTQAFRNPRLFRALEWTTLRTLWEELAPGEPPPEGVRLPEAAGATPAASAPSTARDRRFSDIASRLASRELAVLAKAYAALQARPGFSEEFARVVGPLLGRPTPLQFAEQLGRIAANPHVRFFLKREDARAITPEQENAVAQCHIATLLGRPAVITGNDADAHALAVAEAAPRFGLQCVVVVRPADLEQKPALVAQLRERGAQVEAMPAAGMLGSDPREGALRRWLRSMGSAHLVLSLGLGPSPYPAMANTLRSLLGRETGLQLQAAAGAGRRRSLVAAVRSEADSIGFVLPQLRDAGTELAFAEPEPGAAVAATPLRLRACHGAAREYAWLRGLNRVEHIAIPDAQAAAAQRQLEHAEQVRVSFEDARAVALALLLCQRDQSPHDYVILAA